jgi:hypothetical protein
LDVVFIVVSFGRLQELQDLHIKRGFNEGWATHRYLHGDIKGKGKAIPLQTWTGREGSRRLSLPDFKTVDT